MPCQPSESIRVPTRSTRSGGGFSVRANDSEPASAGQVRRSREKVDGQEATLDGDAGERARGCRDRSAGAGRAARTRGAFPAAIARRRRRRSAAVGPFPRCSKAVCRGLSRTGYPSSSRDRGRLARIGAGDARRWRQARRGGVVEHRQLVDRRGSPRPCAAVRGARGRRRRRGGRRSPAPRRRFRAGPRQSRPPRRAPPLRWRSAGGPRADRRPGAGRSRGATTGPGPAGRWSPRRRGSRGGQGTRRSRRWSGRARR